MKSFSREKCSDEYEDGGDVIAQLDGCGDTPDDYEHENDVAVTAQCALPSLNLLGCTLGVLCQSKPCKYS